MTMRVRDMTIDDCDAVATIRVGGWRFAYTGLVPQSYLDAMNAADDAAERRSLLVDGAGAGVSNVVAEWAGEVVGWGCFGPLRDEGGEKHPEVCELYAIYVRPERISSGVGHALMAELTAARGRPGSRRWSCGSSGTTPAPAASTSARASHRTAPKSPSRSTANASRRSVTSGV